MVQISDLTGDIVVCAGPVLLLTDVNGRPLAAAHAGSDIVSCCLGEVPEWMDGRVIVTGHVDGMVRVWQVGFWEYGRRKEVDAAIAARQHARATAPHSDESWVSVSETINLETFLQDLYSDVPFCLKLQAMLDWHSNPVTAVLVTQYVVCCLLSVVCCAVCCLLSVVCCYPVRYLYSRTCGDNHPLCVMKFEQGSCPCDK